MGQNKIQVFWPLDKPNHPLSQRTERNEQIEVRKQGVGYKTQAPAIDRFGRNIANASN